ncbi:MAG: thioesterase family protein [Pseudomonadota bacterium]
MPQFPLDTATLLTPIGDTRLQSDGGAAYWNFRSGFGGWALALGLAAVQHIHPQTAMLASATATFLKPLPEKGLVIDVRMMREGRSTTFVRAEFFADANSTAPIFAADYVFCDLKDTALDFTTSFPLVKSPEDSTPIPSSPGPKWLGNYDQRFGLGAAFTKQDAPHSAVWVRDVSDRVWDEKALLAVSDTPMPRTFFLDPAPRFGATVTYDLQVFCSREELVAQGSEYLLVEANSDRVGRGRFSQTTRVWSSDQKLLATSNQLAFY